MDVWFNFQTLSPVHKYFKENRTNVQMHFNVFARMIHVWWGKDHFGVCSFII